ncbi:restriction endonuclease subunit S, partial [Acetobacter tropicalis]
MLPDGWKSVPLAEICSSPISYGIVQTGEHVPNGIPCLRVIDIAKKEIDLNECIRTNETINSQYKRTVLNEGDIVLALRGEIGLAKIIEQRHAGANITRGLAKISSDRKKLAPHFLIQALSAPSLKAELDRRSGGSALQEISLGELRKASILIPPLPEQKKIAAILSTWDRAIEWREKLL